MKIIRRLYVEKKPDFEAAAGSLLVDLRENLGLDGLKSLRIVNRYDVEGMDEEDWEKCKLVFSEPAADHTYDEPPWEESDFALAVRYLPGQYDQRADSAVQCIQIVTGKEAPPVETARVYVCGGTLTETDKQTIRDYFINPVDSMEASPEIPVALGLETVAPEEVAILSGFIAMGDETVKHLHETLGLAMRPEDLLFCRAYFQQENRDPSITEIRVLDTYWSDHCRHTTFTTRLDQIDIMDGFYKPLFESAYQLYLSEREQLGEAAQEREITLMDIALTGMRALKKKGFLKDLDESEEINACSIVIPVDVNGVTEEWLLLFKNETHNHPTEIEPFGGAATCLGGAIRDPLSGRAYVYQAMRVTGSGDPTVPVSETWAGKLPQRKITTLAAAGFSAYGNQIGLATGHVAEIYHPGYRAKRLEIGAVIGAVKRDCVRREKPVEGDLVLLLGGRTGRDGCGGATGSSKEHTEESLASCGAEVQKGNPLTERKLQRLFRNPEAARLIKRCNDFGAGGVSVAIGELADGLRINLDAVPKKYEGLDGTEIAISESQERMAVVVAPGDAAALAALAEAENLEATIVATVTGDGRVVMEWRGKTIVDIERTFLSSSGAPRQAPIQWVSPQPRVKEETCNPTRWLETLQNLRVASQKGLVERFDASIGAGTLLMPFGGRNRLTPAQAMAAKIPVLSGETETVSLMAYGFDPYTSEWSPFHGAVQAVVESVAKIVAAGGSHENIRLTFQEFFEKPNEDPQRWHKPFAALLGGLYAQLKLQIPAIGGKDSMSGSFLDKDVPPTLVSFAVQTAKAEAIISPELKKPGHCLIRLNAVYDRNAMPYFDTLKALFARMTQLIREKRVVAAYALGEGGVAAALTKMALGNGIGATITGCNLYQAEAGSFLLELDGDPEKAFCGLPYEVLGMTDESHSLSVNGKHFPLSDCCEAWLSPLENVFPTGWLRSYTNGAIQIPVHENKRVFKPLPQGAQPRVFMPVFPGINCEYDTQRAFEKAGALVDVFVIRNHTVAQLEDSIREMARRIAQAQILSIPGGFSAGDEPEGSGKFIAAILRNDYIAEAVHSLLQKRDGLVIGICNGFQALLKSGLLPYGEIRPMTDDSPTLTFNTIGRHVSDLVWTRIASNQSPWLWHTQPGDRHLIPVSHGEGRFMASEECLHKLAQNQQIAAQYVDFDGVPSMDIRHNPNGSCWAIEAITSPDGRILGKMGHSERIGKHLYKGFEGQTDQQLFEAGCQYFA